MPYSREPEHNGFQYPAHHASQYGVMAQPQFSSFDSRHHGFNIKQDSQLMSDSQPQFHNFDSRHQVLLSDGVAPFQEFEPRHHGFGIKSDHIMSESNPPNSLMAHIGQLSPQETEYSMHQRFMPHSFHTPQNMVDVVSGQQFHSYHDSRDSTFHHNSNATPPIELKPSNSHLRIQAIMEAQTAAAQKPDEIPLTYLNKSQYYAITLFDKHKQDINLTTTIALMFYDECHRKMAGTYWGFWLSQQPSPRSAKALVMDKGGSTGIIECDLSQFDRTTVTWNGRKGARLMIRFNCLSTDFSRIKGVKGIPMRIHSVTRLGDDSVLERCFAKVKLFRDKGAERKNKDDQRHIEKIWDKMKGKSMEEHPMLAMFLPVSPVTEFRECSMFKDVNDSEREFIFPSEEDAEDSSAVMDSTAEVGQLLGSGRLRERRFDTLSGTDISELTDVDPSYIPHLRQPKPLLCLFVKLFNESVYRAIYLEKLTVTDLVAKLAAKLKLHANATITSLSRMTPRGISVQVDDTMISQMVDEMDIIVDCEFTTSPTSTKMALILKY